MLLLLWTGLKLTAHATVNRQRAVAKKQKIYKFRVWDSVSEGNTVITLAT